LDSLLKTDLTAEYLEMVRPYDESLFKSAVDAAPNKIGSFVATTTGFSKKSASVSFEGDFTLNYYFTPSVPMAGDMTLYVWTPEVYAANATLSASCAQKITMTQGSDGRCFGQVTGIAAKNLDETYYVAGVYTDETGNTYCTGVIPYSLSKYCIIKANDDTAGALAQATAMYGYYAKQYFVK
jgi:hypothetical protein